MKQLSAKITIKSNKIQYVYDNFRYDVDLNESNNYTATFNGVVLQEINPCDLVVNVQKDNGFIVVCQVDQLSDFKYIEVGGGGGSDPLAEKLSNKVTSIAGNINDINYPTAQAVALYISENPPALNLQSVVGFGNSIENIVDTVTEITVLSASQTEIAVSDTEDPSVYSSLTLKPHEVTIYRNGKSLSLNIEGGLFIDDGVKVVEVSTENVSFETVEGTNTDNTLLSSSGILSTYTDSADASQNTNATLQANGLFLNGDQKSLFITIDGGLEATDLGNSKAFHIGFDGLLFRDSATTSQVTIGIESLSSARTLFFPDADGTLVTKDQITMQAAMDGNSAFTFENLGVNSYNGHFNPTNLVMDYFDEVNPLLNTHVRVQPGGIDITGNGTLVNLTQYAGLDIVDDNIFKKSGLSAAELYFVPESQGRITLSATDTTDVFTLLFPARTGTLATVDQITSVDVGNGISFESNKINLGMNPIMPWDATTEGLLVQPMALRKLGISGLVDDTESEFLISEYEMRMASKGGQTVFLESGIFSSGAYARTVMEAGTGSPILNITTSFGTTSTSTAFINLNSFGDNNDRVQIGVDQARLVITNGDILFDDMVNQKGAGDQNDYSANKTDYSYATKSMLENAITALNIDSKLTANILSPIEDSVATDVAGILADFNMLLMRMRMNGFIAN